MALDKIVEHFKNNINLRAYGDRQNLVWKMPQNYTGCVYLLKAKPLWRDYEKNMFLNNCVYCNKGARVKRIIAVFISLLWCHLLITDADATQLLGSWNVASSAGGTSIYYYEGQFTPSSVFFYLTFSNPSNPYDFTEPLFSTPFSSGATGIFDYNSSNTPDFSVFVQHLTNNSDELIKSWEVVLDREGVARGGGAGGNL